MKHKITTPLTKDKIEILKAGDVVELSGTVYTARDAAHKRLFEMILAGEKLPFDLSDQVIYYMGPCPAPPGRVIGSAGPTTSGRMDYYTPKLIEMGITGMIGKGQRSREVIDAMVKYGAVYFGAVGGAGALISKSVQSQEIIAFEDLGTEAVRKLSVVNFPLIVVIDRYGNNMYDIGRSRWKDI
ncbi:tartrate/fumarate subfamily Fe-S type hydro-lyase beta subunit [Thermoclostridium stercorarium subsp. stercorarium DSM 8532]|jgi:fumarate hydratase subunit beta|uniref:Tartrate/fumarate subfamily Fe-S type hydro-lyase beta subunit n=3 Tax=Thermoclostridium stercorarium TaxID=1510 RepID=L7VNA5_THES1|nr:Fe-S-containing hydro-lyase [Thermoclostridium stercorarium]AGC68237.1 tartrate/fumarate subfamily Fe-S type hydro-lyase beta subunit [Thermoclostridium stercorarium subsp. stercorarium DSM 8532]AGI39264.1 hydrolyase beta subunit [Thermoclostridium stercorarium subsp. stercorarium DSM 8532]ANW98599.1 fumarate hydratase [Thermoclostridium stercorarium subsp. thermolacticum DSM 2910]ANX01141.1 fumarate hydratase [Thermoclostridium stercorarium subsp. leptospartum DSM 9219]UZQ86755.1 Fe-S-cont